MIFALERSKLILLIVFVIVGTIAVMALVDGGENSAQIWARRSSVILVLTALVGALSVPRIFAFVHAITFAKYWWFPLLDGEWEATIRTNWERIRRTYEAAHASGAPFDAVRGVLSPEEEARSLVKAKVTIVTSLVHFSIKLEPLGSSRISRSRFVRPDWRKPALPELSYVYEQFDPERVAETDARKHFGAGLVIYDVDTDVISGEYWTQRREDLGFNTAGTITLTRRPAA